MNEASPDLDLKYAWQHAYFDALIEFHPEHISHTLSAAERAISRRLLQNVTDPDEMLALRNAVFALRTLFRKGKLRVGAV
jgi:hypothetical protein